MEHQLHTLLARTRALVEESRRVKSDKQHIYSQARQAATSARAQLEAHKELLQDIHKRL